MTILLLAEHDNENLSESTARTLTAASQMGDAVDILVAGQGAADVAQAAARLTGVRRRWNSGWPNRPPRCSSRWRRTMAPSSHRRPAPARTSCRASPPCST